MNRQFVAALTASFVVLLTTLVIERPFSQAKKIEGVAASQPNSVGAQESGIGEHFSIMPGATCFCRISVNGAEIEKRTNGGYIQGLQKGKCERYCQGQWDAATPADLLNWAKKRSGACGNVDLRMEAAIGTAGYETVRSTTISLGGGANPCPYGGNYDSANCLVATPPPATQPFIYRNNFYYNAVSSNPTTRCPMGWWDGAHCQISNNLDEAIPFIYEGRFYILSACDDRNNWSGWDTAGNTYGTLYGRAKHRKAELKWELTSALSNLLGQVTGTQTINTNNVEYIKICQKEGGLGDPCNGTTTTITGWKPSTMIHDLKSNQLYKFKVMMKSINGTKEFFVGDAVKVTTK